MWQAALDIGDDIPLKVSYVERRPKLSAKNLICWMEQSNISDTSLIRQGDEAFEALVLAKPKVWEYEEEWRIQKRFEGANSYQKVPSLLLTEVLVGMRVSAELLSKIEGICGDKVPVSKIGMDSETFELKRC